MGERLYRSREDRMLFGVAGGMARWLDLDPSIVRLIWALLILAGGVGFILYIIAAIVIPEAPPGWEEGPAGGPADAGGASGSAAPASGEGAPGTAWGSTVPRRAARRGSGNAGVVLGLILIGLGAWFLFRQYLPQIDPALVWPIVLVVIGAALVIGALGRGRRP